MEVDQNASVCPVCQYEFARLNVWVKVIAVILILAFIYLMFS